MLAPLCHARRGHELPLVPWCAAADQAPGGGAWYIWRAASASTSARYSGRVVRRVHAAACAVAACDHACTATRAHVRMFHTQARSHARTHAITPAHTQSPVASADALPLPLSGGDCGLCTLLDCCGERVWSASTAPQTRGIAPEHLSAVPADESVTSTAVLTMPAERSDVWQ